MTKVKNTGLSAIEAKSRAQDIAFAPVAFFASVVMRDTGLLAVLAEAGTAGLDVADLVERSGIAEYGVLVLLDYGTDLGLVTKSGETFSLDAVGRFMLHDEMTRVNMDFTRDVFYKALPFLEESIRTQKPAGLKTLGPWETIYEGLTKLPEPARSSWFRFDHFYSDRVFDALLPIVFERPVKKLLDIGGNTGRWTLKCLDFDPNVTIAMMDLEGQLEEAQRNVEAAGFGGRVSFHPTDFLKQDQLFETDADALWMSQFLDCFSEPEICSILTRAAQSMSEDATLYIVELFPDRQAFDAAKSSLDATSLYFTCIANGTSRMYNYDRFQKLVLMSGLKITREIDGVGVGHTVLCCQRAN